MPIYLVKVLCYWYQQQSMYVKWGSALSSKFHVRNGVRQGGVLPPLSFNLKLTNVNELSELMNKSGLGGNMGGAIINHILYADDICIVSLSSSGLQQLLNIFAGVTMTLFRAHGRVSGPISLWNHESHSTTGNWCPTSHVVSLARRRGPWYPMGWWRSMPDRVSRVLVCMTSPCAKLKSDRY